MSAAFEIINSNSQPRNSVSCHPWKGEVFLAKRTRRVDSIVGIEKRGKVGVAVLVMMRHHGTQHRAALPTVRAVSAQGVGGVGFFRTAPYGEHG